MVEIVGCRLGRTASMTSLGSMPCRQVEVVPEVGVAELALDDVDRDALPREFDGMRVTKLVGREPTSDSSLTGELAQLGPGRAR